MCVICFGLCAEHLIALIWRGFIPFAADSPRIEMTCTIQILRASNLLACCNVNLIKVLFERFFHRFVHVSGKNGTVCVHRLHHVPTCSWHAACNSVKRCKLSCGQ